MDACPEATFTPRRSPRLRPLLGDDGTTALRFDDESLLDVQRTDASHENVHFQVDDHSFFQRQVRGDVDRLVPQAQPVVRNNDRVVADLQSYPVPVRVRCLNAARVHFVLHDLPNRRGLHARSHGLRGAFDRSVKPVVYRSEVRGQFPHDEGYSTIGNAPAEDAAEIHEHKIARGEQVVRFGGDAVTSRPVGKVVQIRAQRRNAGSVAFHQIFDPASGGCEFRAFNRRLLADPRRALLAFDFVLSLHGPNQANQVGAIFQRSLRQSFPNGGERFGRQVLHLEPDSGVSEAARLQSRNERFGRRRVGRGILSQVKKTGVGRVRRFR